MKRSTIHRRKDFWAGLMLVTFGAGAILGARLYPMGTATHMGPGYFPLILGTLLGLLGIVVAANSFAPGAERVGNWRWRPLLALTGPIVFTWTIQPLGLVLSTLVLISISCAAGPEFRVREAVLLSLLLAGLATVVFVIGLGLPLNIWPL